jgi:phage-related protein
MADNELRVVITGTAAQLRDAIAGAKGDLSGLKAAIKDVPDKVKIDVQAETALVVARLRELKDAAKDVPTDITITAEADTGIASAKLRLLKAQARDTEESIARAQLGGLLTSGGGAGGGLIPGLGSVIPGGAIPGGTQAIAAATPAIAALAGALTALAGSLGAAALGATAVATGFAGVVSVGFGAMLPVLVSAVSGIKAVSMAMGALEKAQAVYGAGSHQAAVAQANLNAAIGDAGPLAAGIAKQLSALSDQWQQVSAPAQQALERIIVPGLQLVSKLMPTVAQIATQSFQAIGAALDPVFKGLASPAFKQVLIDLGNAFSRLAGPMIAGFSSLMRAFFSVAVAAAPFVVQIAQAFERWSRSFAESLAPGHQLNDLIGGLVGQLHSWWNLATSIGKLMITIFSAGASTGQGLVGMLTDLVRQWNAWLNTKQGQEALKSFFTDSARLVGALVKAFGPLALALTNLIIKLMPAFTLIVKAITPVITLVADGIGALADALKHNLALQIVAVAGLLVAGGPIVMGLVLVAFTLSHLKDIVGFFKDAWTTAWDAVKTAFSFVLDFLLGGISSLLGALKSVFDAVNIDLPIVGHIFGSTGTAVSKALGEAQHAIDAFRQTLHPTADATKTTTAQIASSYQVMARNVGFYLEGMISATTAGLTTVDKKLVDELNRLGIKADAKTLQGLLTFPGQPGSFPSLTQKPPGAATGALIQVGRPGEGGHDTVPMSVGGQDIVVGAGEQVAVFNRHQQADLNAQLSHEGGLSGFFAKRKKPNYMAQGGLVPSFTTGGGVGPVASGSPTGGYVYPWPAGTTVERIDDGQDASMPVGAPIGPIGPARYGGQRAWGGAAGNQPIMWWQLASGPRAGSWVYLAEQINPKPWSGILQPNQAAATFAGSGTNIEMGWMADGSGGNTLAQARGHGGEAPSPEGQDFANFIAGLARGVITGGGGSSFGVSPIPWTNIAAPAWKGPGGIAQALGEGIVKIATAAANQRGQSLAGSSGGAAGSTGGSITALPGGWFRTGATIDPTGGQTGDPNMTFAELLEAGTNTGMRPDLTQLLGEPRGSYGMPMGTAIQIRMPGASHAYSITKNDVGSGQAGNAHYTIDLHPGIASALGWSNNEDVEVKHAALGGLLDGFATGGIAHSALAHTKAGPKGTGKKIPPEWLHRKPGSMRKHKKHKGLPGKPGAGKGAPTQIGTEGPFPFKITDLPQIDKVLSQILGLDGGQGGTLGGSGDAKKMSDLITWNEQLWGSSLYPSPNLSDATSPGNFVISTDAAGNAITPYISQNINQVVGQLSEIVGWEGQEITDMRGALSLSQGLGPVLQKAIARRQAEVAKIRKRIEENVRKIAALVARIKAENQKKPPVAKPKTAADRAANKAFEAERKWHITAANILIGDYEKENVQLGGAKRAIGSPVGGELGTITAELGTPASAGVLGTVLGSGAGASGGLYQLQSIVSGWVQTLSGVGGSLESTGLTFAQDKQTLAALLPGANTALAGAAAAAGANAGTGAGAGPDLSALNALLAQELATAQQALALSQAQFGVFRGFEPLLQGRLVGSFQSGVDFVPQTGLALVHKGETILPDPSGPAGNRAAATVHTQDGPVQIDLHFEGDSGTLVKLVDARINNQALRVVSDHSGQRARLLSGVH